MFGALPGIGCVVSGHDGVDSPTVVPMSARPVSLMLAQPIPAPSSSPTGATTLRPVPSPFPVTPRAFEGERAGRRALAVRIIGETGARAAQRSFADEMHPPSRFRAPGLGLDRVPGDVVRRGMAKFSRLVVNRAGGVLLRIRRGDADRVAEVHRLDHERFEREHPLDGETR